MEGENNQNQSMNIEKAESANSMPVPLESSNNKLKVRETMAISGVRPIGASDLQVVETLNIMGVRPIAANTIRVVDTMNLSGIRPITANSLVISETYSVMGNRPVASNEIDDYESLMGFLD